MTNQNNFLIISATILALILISFAGYIIYTAATNLDNEANIGELANEDNDANIGELTNEDNTANADKAALVNTSGNDTELLNLLEQLLDAISIPKFIALTYHHLDPEPIKSTAIVTPDLFESHITSLNKSDYDAITYEQLTKFIEISSQARRLADKYDSNKSNADRTFSLAQDEQAWIKDSLNFLKYLPKKGYHITFDDGYQSVYEYAMPILLQHDIPMTFFIITKSSRKEHDEIPYYITYPHITWEELQTMKRYPQFQIQSHTYSLHSYEPVVDNDIPAMSGPIYHTEFGRVETHDEFLVRIYEDMILSKSYLENRLKKHQVTGLSYPYGVYSDDVIEMALQAGIKYLFTNRAGLITHETPATEIPRLNAGASNISAKKLMSIIDSYF